MAEEAVVTQSDPLFVGNLGMYVDEDELRLTFSRFGVVTMAQVKRELSAPARQFASLGSRVAV